jgi:hypothetical protein
LENVHDQPIEDMAVFRAQGIKAIENDEFDIVVRLLDDKVNEAGRRRWTRRG